MRLFYLTVCALLASVAQSEVTGFRTAVTQDGLTFIADTARKLIAAYFTEIKVPDNNFEKDGFKIEVKDISCNDIVVGDISLQANDGITAHVGDVSLKCHADWKYELHIWPHIPRGSGSVDVTASGGALTMDIGLGVDGAKHADVSAKKVTADIGDLHLKFHGGITAFILNLIKDLFGHEIRDSVQKSMVSAMTDMINKDINAALARIPTEEPIKAKAPYNVTLAHLGLTSIPEANAHYVGAGLQGYLSPLRNPNAIAPYSPPSLPGYDAALASDSYIQLMVSTFLVESAIWSYQTQNLLKKLITADKVPKAFPFKLDTSDPIWKSVAPGLSKAFPSNENMDLLFSIGSGSTVSCSEKDQVFSMSMPVEIAVQVDESSGAKDAFVLGCPLGTSLTIQIGNDPSSHTKPPAQVITGVIKYLKCDLSQVKSNVGEIHYSLLKDAIDFAFTDILVPIANDLLKTGLPVPVTKGIGLTDTRVNYGNGYAALGSKVSVDVSSIVDIIQEHVQTIYAPKISVDDMEQEEKPNSFVNSMSRNLRA